MNRKLVLLGFVLPLCLAAQGGTPDKSSPEKASPTEVLVPIKLTTDLPKLKLPERPPDQKTSEATAKQQRPTTKKAGNVQKPRTDVAIPPTTMLGREVSIILSERRFYPSRIRLSEGGKTRLFFTTVNQKPAALVMERLNVHAWLNRPAAVPSGQGEINREISSAKITEITFDTQKGVYKFHDAITGASGEIVVE